jgi:hypothetical protein
VDSGPEAAGVARTETAGAAISDPSYGLVDHMSFTPDFELGVDLNAGETSAR